MLKQKGNENLINDNYVEKKPEAGYKFIDGHLAHSFEAHKYPEDTKRPGIRIKVKTTFKKT